MAEFGIECKPTRPCVANFTKGMVIEGRAPRPKNPINEQAKQSAKIRAAFAKMCPDISSILKGETK